MPNQLPDRPQRKIDTDIKVTLSLQNRLKLISRYKIKLWHALLIAVFFAGFVAAVVWVISEDYFSRTQAVVPEDIINVATVTYEDVHGTTYTASSNQVTTTLNTDIINIKLAKDCTVPSTDDRSGDVTLQLYTPGTNTLVHETVVTVDSTGFGTTPLSAAYQNQSYDIVLKPLRYLTKVVSNQTITPDLTIDLDSPGTTFLAGDAAGGSDGTGDDTTNSVDYSFVKSKWWQTDHSLADLNDDGLVNAVDYGCLNSNYFVDGEGFDQWNS